ncbi:MAG TPA: hypothetical protein PLC98_24315 [Anaerolineales bacterium]|nr:hypothetical protein [Anaerolineales bacterium]
MFLSRVWGTGRRWLYWTMLSVVTLVIGQAYVAGLHWHEPRLALADLIAGTAHRPFVYRVLVPTLVGWASNLFSVPAETCAAVVVIASLFGFVVALRSLAGVFWHSPRALDLVGLAAVVCLLPFMLYSRHLYDFTGLLLFTLGLYLLALHRWRWYLPVYALALLNKETAVLLIGVYGLNQLRAWRSLRFWGLLGIQTLVFVTLRLIIQWRFQGNPGAGLEFHWPDQLRALEVAPGLVAIYSLLGLLVLWLALAGARRKPEFLQCAALAVGPALFVAYQLWGFPFEIRNLYEAYPIFLLLSLPTLGRLIGVRFDEPTGTAAEPHERGVSVRA